MVKHDGLAAASMAIEVVAGFQKKEPPVVASVQPPRNASSKRCLLVAADTGAAMSKCSVCTTGFPMASSVCFRFGGFISVRNMLPGAVRMRMLLQACTASLDKSAHAHTHVYACQCT